MFINCHLAGGVGKTNAAERQQQIDQIVSLAYKGERGTQYQSYEVANHNVKVLFGDLNFRLNLNHSEVHKSLENSDFDKLMAADELYRMGLTNAFLRTCQEGKLLFAPTYKYDMGRTTYDTSEKKRVPAWTDRVFFSQTNPCLTLAKYGRSEVTLSDHRPVFAKF